MNFRAIDLEERIVALKQEIATKDSYILKHTRIPSKSSSRFRGSRFQGSSVSVARRKQEFEMPRDLVENQELDDAISRTLPKNYNFEIKKTLWRIRRSNAKRVAIQFPEGLLLFACPISDLLERFAKVEVVIFADVTYGACCVDDFAAQALQCELLVHYGHSCLVPIDAAFPSTGVQMMYVFVDISFEVNHLVESVKLEFPPTVQLALLGTIQFSSTLHVIKPLLDQYFTVPVVVPQAKPLSGGEVLGCTSPILDPQIDALVFVADGRFHLESCMIANPQLASFRYDPFAKVLSREGYAFDFLLKTRGDAILSSKTLSYVGVILGTLGRQGNTRILERITKRAREKQLQVMVVLLSELSPQKLRLMESQVQFWVQIACPRLSMDWSEAFSTCPLLTPFEFFVLMGDVAWSETKYPQDFYAKGSGPWTNYFEEKNIDF